MALSAGDRAFVAELFAGVGDVEVRRAMAGVAVYSRGRVFAMMMGDGRIRLKAKGALAQALESEGAEQFVYSRKDGKVVRTGYWTLPDSALDDPEAATEWGRRALAAAYG